MFRVRDGVCQTSAKQSDKSVKNQHFTVTGLICCLVETVLVDFSSRWITINRMHLRNADDWLKSDAGI